MDMFAFLADPTAYVALITLIVMEVVLGIDNLIFISILTNKLPKGAQKRAAPHRHFRSALSCGLYFCPRLPSL